MLASTPSADVSINTDQNRFELRLNGDLVGIVGYFEVERARPGINMPLCDPDGNSFLNPDPATGLPLVDADGCLALPPGYKYYDYYRVIYPDGYTYGKELGTDGVDTDGISRPRAFYLIDRSIPVDFRRGRSWNWKNVILLERKL